MRLAPATLVACAFAMDFWPVLDIAGNVLASCYLPYITLDIAGLPALQVGCSVGLLNLIKACVGTHLLHSSTAQAIMRAVLLFWSRLPQPFECSRRALLAMGLLKAYSLYVALVVAKVHNYTHLIH